MVLLAVLFLAADVSTACTGYWFVAAAVVTYLIAAAIVHKNKFFCYFGIFFTFCIYCAFMTAQSENSSMIDMYNKTQAVITGTVSRIKYTRLEIAEIWRSEERQKEIINALQDK